MTMCRWVFSKKILPTNAELGIACCEMLSNRAKCIDLTLVIDHSHRNRIVIDNIDKYIDIFLW